MKKKDLVILVQNAYTHYNLKTIDTKFIHIECLDFPGPPVKPSKVNQHLIQQPVLFPQPAPIMSTSIQPQKHFWINESSHPVVVDRVIKDFLEEANQNQQTVPVIHTHGYAAETDDREIPKNVEIDWPWKEIGSTIYSLKGINYAFIDIGVKAVRCSNVKLNKSMEVHVTVF